MTHDDDVAFYAGEFYERLNSDEDRVQPAGSYEMAADEMTDSDADAMAEDAEIDDMPAEDPHALAFHETLKSPEAADMLEDDDLSAEAEADYTGIDDLDDSEEMDSTER